MSVVPSSSFCRTRSTRMSPARPGLSLLLTSAACLALPVLLSGCNRASAGITVTTASPQVIESAREQLELIPPPSKTRYMSVHTLTTWENPYLTIQENMATLHVTLADANTSDLGSGGMLRPVGARRQDLVIRVSDLPAALNAIPENSWPYGRVVAVEEAHDTPTSARPAVRRNVEATIKTLGDLGVVVYEWNEGGSLR
ncbi:MAG TPA: hypothetical protein VGN01_18490 [Acidobacteriaceae bacterium]